LIGLIVGQAKKTRPICRHAHCEIDALNARTYDTLNNGVYKAGFATSQAAYEEAVAPLFDTLDWLEARLTTLHYLTGDSLTEADIRLFTTLVRFDAVYVGHFKCNLRRIADYPHLSAYTRDIYQLPGIAETVNIEHIKRHHYESLLTINPTGIVPAGPRLDFLAPHRREAMTSQSLPRLSPIHPPSRSHTPQHRLHHARLGRSFAGLSRPCAMPGPLGLLIAEPLTAKMCNRIEHW
jgi:glutathionyl-hydroquinone reductase